MAVVHRDHPLAARERIEVSELVAGQFAALPPSYSSRLVFNTLLPEALRAVQPQLTTNSIPALRAYALSGIGASIMPEQAIWDDAAAADLVALELEGAERTDTRMCLCRRGSRIMGNAARRLMADLAASFPHHPSA